MRAFLKYGIIGETSILYIGGLDATRFATKADFSDYFRANSNPANPEIIAEDDILSYQTESDGNGRLNIKAVIRTSFDIPTGVFNTSNSPSLLTYYIDTKNFSNFIGNRAFSGQTQLKYIRAKGVEELREQWFQNGLARVLDFEEATTLESFSFDNLRFGNDRINIRNVDTIIYASGRDASNDGVFSNYNLENNPDSKKVIYADIALQTINNGGKLDSLFDAETNGADVRYIADVNKGLTVNSVGAITVEDERVYMAEIDFTAVADADFYEVWLDDGTGDVIQQFFPFQEITDSYKLLRGLKPNTSYQLKLKTRDEYYNESEFSLPQTIATNPLPAVYSGVTAYYGFDELTGNLFDNVEQKDGTLSGNIARDGSKYTFGADVGSGVGEVLLKDNDGLTFLEDFTLYAKVKRSAWNASTRAWLVSKREDNVDDVQEYQLLHISGDFIFTIFDEDNTNHSVSVTNAFTQDEDYGIKVGRNGDDIVLSVIEGTNTIQSSTITLPPNTTFFNGASPVRIANEVFASQLNFEGIFESLAVFNGTYKSDSEFETWYNNGNFIKMI